MLQWFDQFKELQNRVTDLENNKAGSAAVQSAVYEPLNARLLVVEQQIAALTETLKSVERNATTQVSINEGLVESQQNVDGRLDLISDIVQKLQKDVRTLEKEPRGLLVDERELALNSDEPWANINFLEFDSAKGFRFEGDWNDAFIEHLKLVGFTGNSDEEIFQRYMARIALSISEKFEAEQKADDEAKGKQSKFE